MVQDGGVTSAAARDLVILDVPAEAQAAHARLLGAEPAEILTAETTVGEESEHRAFGAGGEVGEVVARVRVDAQRQHTGHHRRCCACPTVKAPGHG